MNRFRLIIVGFLLTFLSSWVGLVLLPVLTLADAGGDQLPPPRSALAERGKEVYIAQGCVYCHSQQVRPARVGTDIDRGWGPRRTIAGDYASDTRALLGTMRTGPDLSSIGRRNPSETWHYLHLYNPQITSKGSNMAPFRFLFKTKPIVGKGSPDALNLPPEDAPPAGMEVVPGEDAKALVAYLQSLDYGWHEVPGADRARVESQAEVKQP